MTRVGKGSTRSYGVLGSWIKTAQCPCEKYSVCVFSFCDIFSLLFKKKNRVRYMYLKSHMFSEISPFLLGRVIAYSPRIPQNSISTSVGAHLMKQLIINVLVLWIKLLNSRGLGELFILYMTPIAEFEK